jgi:O-antigen/teichoic acid export membrane protein
MSIQKLAGQTAIYGISSVAARFLNFLLFPYFTRILTTEGYGVVTDLYALIPFALVVLTMGLESGYFRFAGKASGEEEKRTVFANVWGAVSLAAAVFFALVLLFNGEIADALRYGDHPSYVWLTGAIIAIDVFLAIPFARLREQGRAGRFVFVRVASVVINVLLCLFFYSALPWLAGQSDALASIYDPAFGAGYVLVANLAASFITIFMLLPLCGGVTPRISRRVLGPVMLYSMPLLISGIAGTANEYIDRQMIKYLMPEGIALGALAQFGAVSRLGVVLVLFLQMYRMGAEPYFLGSFKKDDFAKMNAAAMKYYLIAAIAIFLTMTLFADLFALILGSDMREGVPLLPVILLSNIMTGIVFNLSFWYKQTGKTRFAIVVTGTGLVFTVVFNILLVPTLGIWGAAIARLICETIMVAVSYALGRRHYPVPYGLRRIGEYVLLGALLYGLSRFTAMMPRIPEYLCNLAFLGVYACYFLRRERIDLRPMVKSLLRRR